MALQKATISNVACVVDSGSPTVPVTDLAQDGGDIVAYNADKLRSLYAGGAQIAVTNTVGTVGGTHAGDGTGLIGIGAAPVKGYGLWLYTGLMNAPDAEVLGGQFYAANSPSSPASSGNGIFGLSNLGYWAGSQDSSAFGLLYGSQNTAQVAGTVSLLQAIGCEGIAQTIHTSGTVTTAWGMWAHVDLQSTGNVTNGAGIRANCGASGGGTITNSRGVHIGSGTGTNVYGLYIENQTAGGTLNYAIYTGLGKVHFGGVMDVASATITTLNGIPNIGDGSTASAGILVLGKTGQSENLIDLKIGGVSKFSVDNAGSVSFVNDLNFNSNTAIFGANQDVRIVNTRMDMRAAYLLAWSSTTHAYDTVDTGITRSAAGVVEVNNGTAGTRAQLYAATLRTSQTTVAGLPSAATAGAGARAFVTDASTTLVLGLGLVVAGSGSNKVPVYSDGSSWLYG